MICERGGFICHRHNQVRDFTAGLFQEVCTHVVIEPELQPLTREQLGRSANTEDTARLDIRASSFWGNSQDAFLMLGSFTLLRPVTATEVKHPSIMSMNGRNGQRVCDVEHGTFISLVGSTGGGLAKEALIFFKRLAGLISVK